MLWFNLLMLQMGKLRFRGWEWWGRNPKSHLRSERQSRGKNWFWNPWPGFCSPVSSPLGKPKRSQPVPNPESLVRLCGGQCLPGRLG